MNSSSRLSLPFSKKAGGILSRVVAAILGGYALANTLTGLVAYLLPMPHPESVMTSLMLSFLLYLAAVIWVFSVKTAQVAWIGLLIPGFFSVMLVWLLMPQNL